MYYVQVEDYPDDDGEWVYDTQVVEVQPHGATQ